MSGPRDIVLFYREMALQPLSRLQSVRDFYPETFDEEIQLQTGHCHQPGYRPAYRFLFYYQP